MLKKLKAKAERIVQEAEKDGSCHAELLSEATRLALKNMIKDGVPLVPRVFSVYHLAAVMHLLESSCPFNGCVAYLKRLKETEKDELELIEQTANEAVNVSCEIVSNAIGSLKAFKELVDEHLSEAPDACRSVLRQVLELSVKLEKELAEVRSSFQELRRRLAAVKDASKRDPLTGLFNRQVFEETVKCMLKKKRELGDDFSLAMIDIDDFKSVNDIYGHLAGDAVLKAIAGVLKSDLRMDDVAVRYGGEEFAVVLAGLTEPEAVKVASRLRNRIEALKIRTLKGDEIKVTASFGVAEAVETDSIQSLVQRADEALYLAKKDGKNTVRSSRDLRLRKS